MEFEIHDSLEARFIGTLLGCGIGDALGRSFEGRTREAIEKLCEGDSSRLYQGRYTDDTQLTLKMAKAFIEAGGYEPAILVKHFIAWLEEPPIGPGMACLNAIYNLSRGIPWTHSGYDSGANGSAMRISPVGLFYRSNIPEMIRIVDETTKITHKQEPATAAALVIARAVAYLTRQEELVLDDFLSKIVAVLQKTEHEKFRAHLNSLDSFLDKPHKEALKELGIMGVSPEYMPKSLPRFVSFIHPYACSTVLAALYCFLRHPNDFFESVNEVIVAGGDTDTTGAICGAMSGAFNGVHKIPKSLIYRLIDYEQIFKTGRDLFRVYKEKYPSE